MPTGYTADIAKGITFKQYALNCARAFGALIMMRDDPADAPIPEKFEPSDYSKKEWKRSLDRLQELIHATPGQLKDMAHNDYLQKKKRYDEVVVEKTELRKKYEDMLAQAKAYVPPTPDHEEYAKFLVEQIEGSIDWDCGLDYWKEPIEQSPKEYLESEKKEAIRMIEYHKKSMDEEIDRTNKRNEWIKALRESLENFQPVG